MRQLLGLLGLYPWFEPNFPDFISFLTDLSKMWEPVIRADDVLDGGLGNVLSQLVKDKDCLVQYISEKLSVLELKHGTINECLAIRVCRLVLLI